MDALLKAIEARGLKLAVKTQENRSVASVVVKGWADEIDPIERLYSLKMEQIVFSGPASGLRFDKSKLQRLFL